MDQQRAAPYLLLLPAFASTLLILLACLVILIVLSLAVQSNWDIEIVFSLQAYERALSSPLVPKLLLRSALIAGAVTLISVALAYPISYFIAFDVKSNKLVWLVVFTLPCWISYLLRIFSWKVILGYQGVVNSSLMTVGLIEEPIAALLFSKTSVIIALTHAWAPFAILPIYVSLEKLDMSLVRAALDLGDRPYQVFLRVIMPHSLPGVIAATVLIFIPTFADYVTPQLLGGPSGVMVGNFIAMQFGSSNNWPMGATVALLSMLVATLVVCSLIVAMRLTVRAFR